MYDTLTKGNMSKTIKITVACPQCGVKAAVPITEKDLGTKKQGLCPKCRKKFLIPIPANWKSKFESDSTQVAGGMVDKSLVLEILQNDFTEYQSFELTSDYYTIGRKNNGGPEFRPDVEVMTTDKKMSRKHCAIRKKGMTGFTLKDLGSKNGVILNGTKLDADEEVYLTDGDTIRIGDTQFHVSIAEQSEDDHSDLTK